MPEKVLLFRLFVGAPSDVIQEVQTIEELITEWNRTQGPSAQTRLEFANWRTHSYPAAGNRPQAIINKQVVDRSDIIVGIFRERFGSPTGRAESGTVEEIQRGIRRGRAVMVYFATSPDPKRGKLKDESVRIEAFKRRFGERALYHTYTTPLAFERAFRQHLANTMHDLLANRP